MASWAEVTAGGELTADDQAELTKLEIPFPLDEHNALLLDNVHPRGHPDPDPTNVVYDLVAIGAGAGGLVSAKQTARRGGRSALIEENLHGGDCLNVGCVPSKALIRAARAVKEVKNASKLGINVSGEVTVDFPFIMERLRRLRAKISPADAVHITAGVGTDVYQGRGVFTGPNTIEVNGNTLNFKKAVVATGGSPRVPPIPGLDSVPYMTNTTLFNLETLPERFVVIGGGPIGMEMAQTFALFGSHVTVVDLSPKVLPREDADAAKIVADSAAEDGVHFELSITDLNFSMAGDDAPGVINVNFKRSDGSDFTVPCEALLVATGRTPNVHGIGLEAAGVEFCERFGVKVDDLMQTSNPDVYSVGDCSSAWQFTHMAGTQAQMVIDNACFGAEKKVSELVIPRCTYTSPEVAGTGKDENSLKKDGIKYDTYFADLAGNDRSILEGSEGFVKMLVEKDGAKILGCTIVAEAAGEMISEVTLAIQAGVDMATIARTIHAYPTVAEGIASTAFQYKTKYWQTFPKE